MGVTHIFILFSNYLVRLCSSHALSAVSAHGAQTEKGAGQVVEGCCLIGALTGSSPVNLYVLGCLLIVQAF